MKNKKTAILTILIVLLIAVIVLLLVLLNAQKQPAQPAGMSGVIEEGWDDEIDTGSVEEDNVHIPGYTSAKMNEGDSKLHLSIGNPEENDVGLYASVLLEDGTVLYESELLKPGFGIKDIPLQNSPAKGTYNAYVVYQIVSLDDAQTPMNSARSAFTLYVE